MHRGIHNAELLAMSEVSLSQNQIAVPSGPQSGEKLSEREARAIWDQFWSNYVKNVLRTTPEELLKDPTLISASTR